MLKESHQIMIQNKKIIILYLLFICTSNYILCSEFESAKNTIVNYDKNHVRIVVRYMAKEPRAADTQPYVEKASSATIVDAEYALVSAHALYKRNDTVKGQEHRLLYETKASRVMVHPLWFQDYTPFDVIKFEVHSLWEDDNTPYEESLNYDIGLIFFPKKYRFTRFHSIIDIPDHEIGFEPYKSASRHNLPYTPSFPAFLEKQSLFPFATHCFIIK